MSRMRRRILGSKWPLGDKTWPDNPTPENLAGAGWFPTNASWDETVDWATGLAADPLFYRQRGSGIYLMCNSIGLSEWFNSFELPPAGNPRYQDTWALMDFDGSDSLGGPGTGPSMSMAQMSGLHWQVYFDPGPPIVLLYYTFIGHMWFSYTLATLSGALNEHLSNRVLVHLHRVDDDNLQVTGWCYDRTAQAVISDGPSIVNLGGVASNPYVVQALLWPGLLNRLEVSSNPIPYGDYTG